MNWFMIHKIQKKLQIWSYAGMIMNPRESEHHDVYVVIWFITQPDNKTTYGLIIVPFDGDLSLWVTDRHEDCKEDRECEDL